MFSHFIFLHIEATPDQKVSLHCRENIFRVVIPGNLLIDQDVTSLHLRDESCVGKFDDNGHFIIESHYDTCGTTQEVNMQDRMCCSSYVISKAGLQFFCQVTIMKNEKYKLGERNLELRN